MKKMVRMTVAAVSISLILLACTACGKEYTCFRCDTVTKEAYYTEALSEDRVMCRECALRYWMPLSIENFRVK